MKGVATIDADTDGLINGARNGPGALEIERD